MKMVEYALSYAAKGYAVFPCHEPVFRNGQLVGCTCEPYRHSDECKTNHPHLYLEPGKKCANPGKCPRLKWGEKSTTDADTIRQWWKWWPKANIGIDCGKSNLLIFDADAYKETFGDIDDLLTPTDRETVTTLTGGGGEHLWYKLDGKHYGNSTKGLPKGIDIRGVGGYIVAPPSLHKSGRRYAFEDGYSLDDLDPQPIPAALDAILSAAHRTIRTRSADVESDSAAVTRSMQLAERVFEGLNVAHFGAKGWGEGVKYILQTCPFNPEDDPHGEDRSAYVTIAADGALSAGCHHNRCQHVIEESGLSGWHLLKQKAGIQPSTTAEPDAFDELLATAREFVKTTSFGPFIDDQYKAHIYKKDCDRIPENLLRIEYRTDGTDTKLVDALLDLAEQARSFTVYASYETLRHLAGLGSKSTVKAALARLFGWLIERNEAAPETDQACTYRVRIDWIADFVARRSNAQYYSKAIVRSIYARQKNDDPFLSGRSRTARRLNLIVPGLGESALRVLDILSGGKGWTRQELTAECEKSLGGIGRICRRLEELGVIYSERESPRQPKQYYLDPDAWAKVDNLRPQLKTYRLSAERRERALAEMQKRAEIQMDMADKPRTVARKAQTIADTIAARRRLLAVIHPEWTDEDTMRWILSPTPNARPWLNKQGGKYTQATTNHLARQQVAPALAYRMAVYAGYTETEAGHIAKGIKEYKSYGQEARL